MGVRMLQRFNNKSGFSLVELMVVVAIIGILASLAIPQVSKFQARARQSEAKTQLAAIYTAEKAFYVEYTAYHNAFAAFGYAPEGTLRYNVGFANDQAAAYAGIATTANGYNGGVVGTATSTTAGSGAADTGYCGTSGAFTATSSCATLNGANGAAPDKIVWGGGSGLPANTCGIVAPGATGPTFVACATAYIFGNSGNTDDVWSIDEKKQIVQRQNGIP